MCQIYFSAMPVCSHPADLREQSYCEEKMTLLLSWWNRTQGLFLYKKTKQSESTGRGTGTLWSVTWHWKNSAWHGCSLSQLAAPSLGMSTEHFQQASEWGQLVLRLKVLNSMEVTRSHQVASKPKDGHCHCLVLWHQSTQQIQISSDLPEFFSFQECGHAQVPLLSSPDV